MLDSKNFAVKRKNAFTLLDVEDTWLLEVWEVGQNGAGFVVCWR